MKKLIAAALVLVGSSAMADTTLFNCVVPSNTNSVTLTVTKADDTSVDYVIASLNEKSGSSDFFNQMDPGTVDAQLANGFLQMLALTERSAQDPNDGVITNTGFLTLNAEKDGSFSGILFAKGNIYPLACTK